MDIGRFALTDRVAIVTGGGRGIGKATAIGLAGVGADVVVAEIDSSTAEQTAQEIRALGRKALAIPLDARLEEDVIAMVRKTTDTFGRIDILVNNVGATDSLLSNPPIWEISEEKWQALINLNLTTTFLCTKTVAKVMADQKQGNIVNMSSASALNASPGALAYSVAKAGVIQITKNLAVQLAPYNIRVNALAPAGFDTPGFAKPPPVEAEFLKRIALNRLGQLDEVASLVVFLVSDASSYITGQVVAIDGGLSIWPYQNLR